MIENQKADTICVSRKSRVISAYLRIKYSTVVKDRHDLRISYVNEEL
jgi:hypothetical protein